MTAVDELLFKEQPLRDGWQGIVASNPTDLSDRLSVVIPGFDPETRWENCRWQARGDVAMPHRGDRCYCVLDDKHELWVLAWWPFT